MSPYPMTDPYIWRLVERFQEAERVFRTEFPPQLWDLGPKVLLLTSRQWLLVRRVADPGEATDTPSALRGIPVLLSNSALGLLAVGGVVDVRDVE